MRTFDLTFTPGETKVLPGGRFLILLTAVTGVDIDYFVGGTNNNENATDVTSGYFYEQDDTPFTSVRITSALAQTIKVAVSRGKGGFNTTSTTLNGGTLAMLTDGEVYARKAKSADGVGQFFGFAQASPPNVVLLFNPAGSGVTFYCSSFILTMQYSISTSAVYTITGGGSSTNLTLPNSNEFIPKTIVAASPLDSRLLSGLPVGSLSSDFSYVMSPGGGQLSPELEIVQNSPIVLPPGKGFGVLNSSPAGTLLHTRVEVDIR